MKGITTMTTRRARTRLLLTAAVAALALTGGAAENASAADSVERATKLLQGKRLTVHIIYENRTHSNIEHRIDFCPRGRVFVKSTFYRYAPIVLRSRGRWRVASAQVRRGFGWAKVTTTAWPTPPTVRVPPSAGRTFKFAPSSGRTLRVVIDRRGVQILGRRAEVTTSPAC
jgi:hypothetical protein